jgi:hypothetical protein
MMLLWQEGPLQSRYEGLCGAPESEPFHFQF